MTWAREPPPSGVRKRNTEARRAKPQTTRLCSWKSAAGNASARRGNEVGGCGWEWEYEAGAEETLDCPLLETELSQNECQYELMTGDEGREEEGEEMGVLRKEGERRSSENDEEKRRGIVGAENAPVRRPTATSCGSCRAAARARFSHPRARRSRAPKSKPPLPPKPASAQTRQITPTPQVQWSVRLMGDKGTRGLDEMEAIGARADVDDAQDMERTKGRRRSKKGRKRRRDSKWIAPAGNGDGKASEEGEETNVYAAYSPRVPPLVPSCTSGWRYDFSPLRARSRWYGVVRNVPRTPLRTWGDVRFACWSEHIIEIAALSHPSIILNPIPLLARQGLVLEHIICEPRHLDTLSALSLAVWLNCLRLTLLAHNHSGFGYRWEEVIRFTDSGVSIDSV
ncbi:hypothetical protein C8R44DRAFT_853217 [Mycena epipterygia]|nr:hypothetical protein C8R44DRAFT_853217 [Mycena epipterygia]